MYINISLRRSPITDNDNNDCISRVYKEGNVSYLCKEDDAVNFPNLGVRREVLDMGVECTIKCRTNCKGTCV